MQSHICCCHISMHRGASLRRDIFLHAWDLPNVVRSTPGSGVAAGYHCNVTSFFLSLLPRNFWFASNRCPLELRQLETEPSFTSWNLHYHSRDLVKLSSFFHYYYYCGGTTVEALSAKPQSCHVIYCEAFLGEGVPEESTWHFNFRAARNLVSVVVLAQPLVNKT